MSQIDTATGPSFVVSRAAQARILAVAEQELEPGLYKALIAGAQ
jgi:hypothetical protein